MSEEDKGKTTSQAVSDFISTQPHLIDAIPFNLNDCICNNGFCTYDQGKVKIVLTEAQCDALRAATKF